LFNQFRLCETSKIFFAIKQFTNNYFISKIEHSFQTTLQNCFERFQCTWCNLFPRYCSKIICWFVFENFKPCNFVSMYASISTPCFATIQSHVQSFFFGCQNEHLHPYFLTLATSSNYICSSPLHQGSYYEGCNKKGQKQG
jgi:hypothetical protein